MDLNIRRKKMVWYCIWLSYVYALVINEVYNSSLRLRQTLNTGQSEFSYKKNK